MYINKAFMKTHPVKIYAEMIDVTTGGKGLVQRWELPWSQKQFQKIMREIRLRVVNLNRQEMREGEEVKWTVWPGSTAEIVKGAFFSQKVQLCEVQISMGMCQLLSAGMEELIPMMLACFLLVCLLTFTFCSGMIALKNLGMQTSNYLKISALWGHFVYFKADTEKQNRIQSLQPFLLGEPSFLHVRLLVKYRSMSPGLAKLSPSHGDTKPFNTQLFGVPISY